MWLAVGGGQVENAVASPTRGGIHELCRMRRNDADVQVDVYQRRVSLGVVQRLRHGLGVQVVPAVREQVFVKAHL